MILIKIINYFIIIVAITFTFTSKISANTTDVAITADIPITTDIAIETEAPETSENEPVRSSIFMIAEWDDDVFHWERVKFSHKDRSWRLPNTTFPLSYHLHITTEIHRQIFEYQGNCTIEVLVQNDTDEIVLHTQNLNILNISITNLATKELYANTTFIVIPDLLIISQNSSSATFVRHQRLSIEILYTGLIRNGNSGFHKLTYTDENNQTIVGASTQLEPIYARTVLPCYDEPSFKSNFNIRITHGSNYTAISNMPQQDLIVDSFNNMTTTVFMETPPMTTYVLAFVISNYVHISSTEGGVKQNIYFPPNSKAGGYKGLQNAAKALKRFGEFLDIPYVLPKLDHALVKESYGKAMENWGLITYSVEAFLKDDETDIAKRFTADYTQNHELVHQWFGNLVSPQWWDSIWLNEGFASYYAYVLTDMISPEYEAMDAFDINICREALFILIDKPMLNYVEKPSDIKQAFSGVVYYKAPCIIQMFNYALKPEIFTKGMSAYLKKFSYGIANEDNLYDELQNVLIDYYQEQNNIWKYSIHEIMKTWTHSKSYPFVTVTRNYTDNTITIRQTPIVSSQNEHWWIPLNFATASQPNFEDATADFFMPPVPELTINLNDLNIKLEETDWFLVNKLGKGFYITQYDDENMRRVALALSENHEIIHRRNRALLVKDIEQWISRGKSFDAIIILRLLKYLEKETDPFVWSSSIDLMYRLSTQGQQLLAPIYKSIKQQNKLTMNLSQYFMLNDLDGLACYLELRECLMESKRKILIAINGTIRVNDINERLCDGAKVLEDDEFELVLSYYMAENHSYYNWKYLTCTKNPTQFERLLQEASYIKANDSQCENKLQFLGSLAGNRFRNGFKMELSFNLLDKQMPELLKTTVCSPVVLCETLLYDASTVPSQFKTQYINFLDQCQQAKEAGTFDSEENFHINPDDIGSTANENSDKADFKSEDIAKAWEEDNEII